MLDPVSVESLSRAALWGAITLVLLFAAFSVTYAQPFLDDWCFAIDPRSPLEQANALYMEWSGRWPAMLLMAASLHGRDLTDELPLYLLWSLPIWGAGFVFAAKAILTGATWRTALLVGGAMLALMWGAAPGTVELFYWMPGTAVYGVSFMLGAGAALLISTGRFALALIPALVAAWMNELAGIALIVAFAALMLSERRAALPLIGAAIGFALVAFSPGNAARGGHLNLDLPRLAYSLVRPYESAVSVLTDPRLLVLALFVACLPGAMSRPARWWLVPLATVAAVVLCNAAFIIASGSTPSLRVLGFMYALGLIGWIATAWMWRGTLKVGTAVPGFALAVAILTAPVVGNNLHDLPMVFSEWNPANKRLYADLRSRAGQDVVVSDFTRYPSMQPNRAIDFNASYLINRCQARYFGLRSIRGTGPSGYRWRPTY